MTEGNLTDQSELVERVARAICDEWGYIWDGDPDDLQTAPEKALDYDERPDKRLYRKAAIAAIAAMGDGSRIEALEADNARLREALKPFARSRDCDWDEDAPDETEVWNSQGPGWGTERTCLTVGDFSKARTALGDKP